MKKRRPSTGIVKASRSIRKSRAKFAKERTAAARSARAARTLIKRLGESLATRIAAAQAKVEIADERFEALEELTPDFIRAELSLTMVGQYGAPFGPLLTEIAEHLETSFNDADSDLEALIEAIEDTKAP